jgi:hypothetical protein
MLKEVLHMRPVLTHQAVKVREVTQQYLPDGITFMGDLLPRNIAKIQGWKRVCRNMSVNEYLFCVGPSVTSRGDFGTSQGIHEGRFSDARTTQESDREKSIFYGSYFRRKALNLTSEGLSLILSDRK